MMQRILLLFIFAVANSLNCIHAESVGSSDELFSKGGCCERGHRGHKGHKGNKGPRGFQGVNGASGPTGNKGPTGPTGIDRGLYGCEVCPFDPITFIFVHSPPSNPFITGNFAVVITFPDGSVTQAVKPVNAPSVFILQGGSRYLFGNYTITFENLDISAPLTDPLVDSLIVTHPCFITGDISYKVFPNGWPLNNGDATELYFAAPPCVVQTT